jgi:hypothetical protein
MLRNLNSQVMPRCIRTSDSLNKSFFEKVKDVFSGG